MSFTISRQCLHAQPHSSIQWWQGFEGRSDPQFYGSVSILPELECLRRRAAGCRREEPSLGDIDLGRALLTGGEQKVAAVVGIVEGFRRLEREIAAMELDARLKREHSEPPYPQETRSLKASSRLITSLVPTILAEIADARTSLVLHCKKYVLSYSHRKKGFGW